MDAATNHTETTSPAQGAQTNSTKFPGGMSAIDADKHPSVSPALDSDCKTVDAEISESDAADRVQSDQADEDMVDEGEEENGDEPDAMITDSRDSINNCADDEDSDKMPNGFLDNFSGEEDIDDEGRLVIDDANGSKPPTRHGNIQNRTYSCHQCDLITTKAKTYLHHLNEIHNAQTSIYECDQCDYATVYKQKLPRHRRLHFSMGEEENELNEPCDLQDKMLFEKIDESSNSNHLTNSSICEDRASDTPEANIIQLDEREDLDDEHSGGMETPSFESMSTSMPLTITTDNIDQVLDDDRKKKKKTRQEVDPGKYFEAVDSSGTKYACSQCGNIYKWRKSLNKHWKEKHMKDPLVEEPSPPGMLELLKSGKYTQLGARRIYDNTFLATIKTQKDDNQSRPTSNHGSVPHSPSPPNFTQNLTSLTASRLAASVASAASAMMPSMIGPFVANSAQPVFPGMPMGLSHMRFPNGYESQEEGALDLTRGIKSELGALSSYPTVSSNESNTSQDQEQPLDFSKKSKPGDNMIKTDKIWNEISSSMKHAHSMNQYIPKVHRCSKCDFTSTSEVDFANHTSSHLNKRIVRCFECKLQLNSMDELNGHFNKTHNKKLTDYKEAIKKIPHGLQQTYHLLKMDLHDIGELGNQDLGAAESKNLKCKKCDFEAKWPAELQKHAVSHSEERPYICMVCGSTYKWKWDLVKHFQKSHPNLANPYRRNDKRDTPDCSSEEEAEEEPGAKRMRMAEPCSTPINGNAHNRDDAISVEGIIAATQAGQRLVSSQPNILDDEPSLERNMAFLHSFQLVDSEEAAKSLIERHTKAQRALQESTKHRSGGSGVRKNNSSKDGEASPGSSTSSKNEELPYKCTQCNYHARWPSEVTQHMKNHSDSKPYLCPRCEYRSKWKWDVVKHLKRCGGGGGIEDVIDTTKPKKKDLSTISPGPLEAVVSRAGPPNAVVSQQGKVKKTTPQPPLAYIMPSIDENGQQSAVVLRPNSVNTSLQQAMNQAAAESSNRPQMSSASLDLSNNSNSSTSSSNNNSNNNNNNNNNDSSVTDNNINNNYVMYSSGEAFPNLNATILSTPASSTFTPICSSVPSNSSSPSLSLSTSSSRQNTGGETWNCPYCPFSTQSQAELKRHSGLHSDDKPFKCDVCHYSTRWACDLKKHRKSYNHYPPSKTNQSQRMDKNQQISKDMAEKDIRVQNRFKCFQCSTYFQSLLGLLDHRKSEHAGSHSAQSSPIPQTELTEIDAARIKHPRKPIKQISCHKCPFVCRNRITMDKHLEEHEQLELNALKCFYCPSQFKDKESLLDHIITHPTFNPKEWETFFMINEDEEQNQNEEIIEELDSSNHQRDVPVPVFENLLSKNKEAKTMWYESEKGGPESEATQARIQQILDEIPKQKKSPSVSSTAPQQLTAVNKYKCEWCPAEFINLTAVYKHASQAHPIQLKEQDMSMALAFQSLPAPKSLPSQPSTKKVQYAGEPLEILRQQIAEKRSQQLAEKFSELFSSNPKLQEVVNKKMEEKKSRKNIPTDRGSFHPSLSGMANSPHQFHIHNNKFQSQCWFCDYSVESSHLLYQHMKISHARKWKATSQDPKYASQIKKMNMAFASPGSPTHISDAQCNSAPAPVKESGAIDLSSKKRPLEVTHDIMYITKQQYTWSGIPVNVIPVGNALNFVCPHCSFNDASIAKTCAHVMQSHRAMSKFTCKQCGFSDDNIHVMSDHCKTSHSIHERVVEVLDFKQLNFSELQMVQLSALRERTPQDLSTSPAKMMEEKNDGNKALSCPFCPFKTMVIENMKAHVSNHSKQARYRCQMCDFSSDSTSIISSHVKVHDSSYDLESKVAPDSGSHLIMNDSGPSERSAHPINLKVKQEISEADAKQRSKDSGEGDAFMDLTVNSDALKEGSPRTKPAGRIRYRCSVCPYHTTCKSNILKHKRQHLHNKRYKCPRCSYSAARAVLLKNHLDAHETPVGEDGLHHDIFCNPNSPNDDLKGDDNEDNEIDEADMEIDDVEDEDTNSDDFENEMDAKAIADLEAKDILEAEAAHKAMMGHEEELCGTMENIADKHIRKQKCPHCPFSSNSGYEFRKHLNFHGTQERYKCEYCSYSLDRLNLLSQHRKLHCDEPGFDPNPSASDLLNTSFILQQNCNLSDTEDEIMSAVEGGNVNSSETQYSCMHCPYKTTKNNLLDIHCNSHGLKKTYLCDYCDWSADRLALVFQHRKVHENEAYFNESLEEKSFLNGEFNDGGTSGEFEAKLLEIKNFEKPAREGEKDLSSSPPFKLTVTKKIYPCKLCPYKTNSKTSYHVHKGMHGSGAEFACNECSYASVNRGLLQQHIHLHSPTKRAGSSSPHSHMKTTRAQSHESELASPPLREPAVISRHAKESDSHPIDETKMSANPELKCQRCPFTAPSQTILSEHMKGHATHDSLVCPYCDFSATSKQDMFPHIQIHFPGTKLEPDALDKVLNENCVSNNNNNSSSRKNDNTLHAMDKSNSSESKMLSPTAVPSAGSQVNPTKIYVCRYCDREFESKAFMLQHEKQHLVGSH